MTISDYDIDINQEYTISSQSQLIAADPDFERDGYVISAWTENADGTGRQYTLEEMIAASEVSSDLTFWAQWRERGILYMTRTDSTACKFKEGSFTEPIDLTSEPFSLSNLSKENISVVDDPYGLITNVDSSFGNSSLRSGYFPGVTEINSTGYIGGFSYCSYLTSLGLPNLSSLSGYCFGKCAQLESIFLPNAITIGDHAFDRSLLTSITVPNALCIEQYSLQSYSIQLSVLVLSNWNGTVPEIDKRAFGNNTTEVSVIIPNEKKNTYLTNPTWNQFQKSDIVELIEVQYWHGSV